MTFDDVNRLIICMAIFCCQLFLWDETLPLDWQAQFPTISQIEDIEPYSRVSWMKSIDVFFSSQFFGVFWIQLNWFTTSVTTRAICIMDVLLVLHAPFVIVRTIKYRTSECIISNPRSVYIILRESSEKIASTDGKRFLLMKLISILRKRLWCLRKWISYLFLNLLPVQIHRGKIPIICIQLTAICKYGNC